MPEGSRQVVEDKNTMVTVTAGNLGKYLGCAIVMAAERENQIGVAWLGLDRVGGDILSIVACSGREFNLTGKR